VESRCPKKDTLRGWDLKFGYLQAGFSKSCLKIILIKLIRLLVGTLDG
jgi:hypothetical protein